MRNLDYVKKLLLMRAANAPLGGTRRSRAAHGYGVNVGLGAQASKTYVDMRSVCFFSLS
jgi:hypothetical protein